MPNEQDFPTTNIDRFTHRGYVYYTGRDERDGNHDPKPYSYLIIEKQSGQCVDVRLNIGSKKVTQAAAMEFIDALHTPTA